MADKHPLMDKVEVAQFLSIKRDAVYAGECGTGHLRKLRMGGTVRWYRPQIELHRLNTIRNLECDGSCVRVFDEAEKEEEPQTFPHLVAAK